MVNIIYYFLGKNTDKSDEEILRARYGMACGVTGILLNIFLFLIKFFAGVLSGAISVISDAFNNLSDAGSSIITLIGFKLSSQEADSEHPYGHGRSEYIAGLVVSILIIVMAVELFRSSITRVFSPKDIEFSIWLLASLIISIIVKLYMYFYNKIGSKRISSPTLMATATDSISDVFSTLLVLICIVCSSFTNWHLDGVGGIIVSFLILRGGIEAAKETINPLLGMSPDTEFLKKIKEYVLAHDEILDVHDVLMHDYGPGRKIISLHAEISASEDVLEIHDSIDNIERGIKEKFHCMATIHMDPIVVDDNKTNECRQLVSDIVKEIEPDLSIHDFRMVEGPTHTNLIFDVVLPFSSPISEEELKLKISKAIIQKNPIYRSVIEIDRE